MRLLQFLCVLICFVFSSDFLFGQSLSDLSWSADGKRISFRSGEEKFVVDIESGTKKQVDKLPEFARSTKLTLPPLKSVNGGAAMKATSPTPTQKTPIS